MNPLTDSDLEHQLTRRSLRLLEDQERQQILGALGIEARRGRKSWRWLVPAAVLVATCLALIPIAISLLPSTQSPATEPPGAAPATVSSAPTTASSEPSPFAPQTPHTADAVLDTSDLVALVQDPRAMGSYVIARAAVNQRAASRNPCDESGWCRIGLLLDLEGGGHVEPQIWVYAREGLPSTTSSPVLALRIRSNELEYLGPVTLAADESIWKVPELLQEAPPNRTADVYPVSGWLVETQAVSCPAPQNYHSGSDLSYYCGGSWVTPTEVRTVTERTGNYTEMRLILDEGLHVQQGAYAEFALDPAWDESGAVPRFADYLVRPAGCPEIVMGDCPVWELIGRLDPFDPTEPAATDFPRQIGNERVLTVDEAVQHVETIEDDTPFLIGGWLFAVEVDCYVPPDFPTTPLLDPCNSGFRLEPTFRQGTGVLLPIVVPPDGAGLPSGQNLLVVVRAHAHDPRAADCPLKYRALCDRSVVVEETVWHSPTT